MTLQLPQSHLLASTLEGLHQIPFAVQGAFGDDKCITKLAPNEEAFLRKVLVPAMQKDAGQLMHAWQQAKGIVGC